MTTIDVERLLAEARDTMSVRRVYGDPIERDGLTIIPAAKVRGGGGGGGGTAPSDDDGAAAGSGSGAGFGVVAHPAGAFVVRGDEVVWQPAVDRQRLIVAVLTVVAITVLAVRSVLVHR